MSWEGASPRPPPSRSGTKTGHTALPFVPSSRYLVFHTLSAATVAVAAVPVYLLVTRRRLLPLIVANRFIDLVAALTSATPPNHFHPVGPRFRRSRCRRGSIVDAEPLAPRQGDSSSTERPVSAIGIAARPLVGGRKP